MSLHQLCLRIGSHDGMLRSVGLLWASHNKQGGERVEEKGRGEVVNSIIFIC